MAITVTSTHDEDGFSSIYLTEWVGDKFYQLVIRDGVLVREDKSTNYSVIERFFKAKNEDVELFVKALGKLVAVN